MSIAEDPQQWDPRPPTWGWSGVGQELELRNDESKD